MSSTKRRRKDRDKYYKAQSDCRDCALLRKKEGIFCPRHTGTTSKRRQNFMLLPRQRGYK